MLKPLGQGLPPLDPSAASAGTSCALPACYEAVREARRFTRATLGKWGLSDRPDDVCLVVSELVTNALRHALAPAAPPPTHAYGPGSPAQESCAQGRSEQRPFAQDTSAQDALAQGSPVRLHLMRWSERLVCAVRDPSRDSPVARDTDDFSAESGRGLFLVDSFSDSWGWHPLADTLGGKVVWALFRLRLTG
jgi:hypothetical protein